MKSLKYRTIREVLHRLLEVQDGCWLPCGRGICLEVGKATRVHIPGTPITPEYAWVGDHAKKFCGTAYVDDFGIMTPKRREFILYLLDRISEETASGSEVSND